MRMSEVLEKMLENDSQLAFYMSNRLLNLSQFAKYVQPLVETQVGQKVKSSTITMALSRLQQKTIQKFDKQQFRINRLSMVTELCTLSFNKTPSTHQKIQQLHNKAIAENVYFVLSETTFEVTIISKRAFIETSETPIPKFAHMELSAIAVQFDPKYLSIPGVMASVMHKLSLQNVNLIEVASTCTEMIFYVDHSDLKLAFETVQDSFFV